MGTNRYVQGQIARLITRDGNVCHWCRRPFTPGSRSPRRISRDHIIPYSLGGLSNDENMVLSCQRCNSTRGSIPYVQWANAVRLAFEQEPDAEDIAKIALQILKPVREIRHGPPSIDPTWEPGTF